MLLPNELETVKEASEYSDEKQEYKIPPFYMKNKTLVFPKLPENQSLEMIKGMQENRNLVFNKDRPPKESKEKENNGGSSNGNSIKEGRDTPVFKNNLSIMNSDPNFSKNDKKS